MHALGKRIISGELQPGDVLPKEAVLSKEAGVSRTVVREAIKGLEARGLLESRPKVGTTIQPRSKWQMLEPAMLGWLTTMETDGKLNYHIAEVRQAIEPTIAELAARNASPKDITKMREAYANLAKSIHESDAATIAELAFHESIVTATHNEILAYIVHALHRSFYNRKYINIFLAKLPDLDMVADPYTSPEDELLSRYSELLDAIITGDGSGARTASFRLQQRSTGLMKHTDD
jgi:DNA-binding FadR family transcriptional regulator